MTTDEKFAAHKAKVLRRTKGNSTRLKPLWLDGDQAETVRGDFQRVGRRVVFGGVALTHVEEFLRL
jgi:hypothetical protein